MKKLTVILVMLLAAVSVFAKGKVDWTGRVVDENGNPVAYANVAVLSKADSTVVCGTVTAEDGSFNIVTSETDGIMMIAMLGYQTIYIVPVDGAVITLYEDSTMLEGAVATAILPKVKLTGEGIQTSVKGSVLENAGTASDVLAKTPGLIKGQDGLEVIGKGAPLVYINGHKVTDSSELQRLQSNEIQSVEVITNPGAQYDATVKSVVRIRTVRRQGEGFGFSVNASDAQSLQWAQGNDQSGAINANYRIGGVDFFAGINYGGDTGRQLSDAETVSYSTGKTGSLNVFENKGNIDAMGFENSISGNGGVNWQIADNHFLGGKVEWGRTFRGDDVTTVKSDVYENGTLVDRLSTVTADALGDKPTYNLGSNLYYNGRIGNMGVDVNLDYFGTGKSGKMTSAETSSMTSDRDIDSYSSNSARMYAGKAVLSYPVWTGQLEVGTEETFTRRSDEYRISGVDIPASSAMVKENNIAGFASYGFMLPIGMMNAGVRYEYVHYAYQDALAPENDIVRNYGNFFPTFSFATALGPVQMMLNYSAKTKRPSYHHLSSAIRYNSRYIWQSGNVQLQPEISNNISLAAIWNFVTLMVDYTRTDDAILTWSAPYGEDGVVLVRPCNIDAPYRAMTAFVNLTPTIGNWNLNYTFGIQPQWLDIMVDDPREAGGKRVVSFNDKPLAFIQVNNTVTVKGGWQFELGGQWVSKGYTENVRLTRDYLDVNAAVQKTLLKDGALVLRLEGHNLANRAYYNVDTDFGSHKITQTNIMDTQKVKLSLRYNFNTAKSKYRGTGAGSENKGRM
jgi:hypothetical protein